MPEALAPSLMRGLSVLARQKSSPKPAPAPSQIPSSNRTCARTAFKNFTCWGLFAEGCVRSTVVEAIKLGYTVHVIANAVATNAAWKKRFALWAMKRAGAKIVASLMAPSVLTLSCSGTTPALAEIKR